MLLLQNRIFGLLAEAAKVDGYEVIIDGTNLSDEAADRPGMKALAEMEVLSPLRMCGITKARVRELSKEAGLFTWDKPAYACLATRIPSGTLITEADLKRVEGAEAELEAWVSETFASAFSAAQRGCSFAADRWKEP